MARFKPPALNLAEAFDAQKSMPSLVESLQFSPGGVKRLKGDDTYSMELNESDLKILPSPLGFGASSAVYKALLARTGAPHVPPKYVAVKKIRNIANEMKKDVSTLMDAARARKTLDAPMEGLVSFEGAYMNNETREVAIVLEYMNGGSLEDVLKKKKTIPEDILSCIALMVLKGLFHLHKQMHIVHRDIKPANILLDLNGVAKISDFGISRPLVDSIALCDTYQGTMVYMSPERLNNKPYGFASDIWSLGLCLVECATGKYPYPTSGGPVTLITHITQDEPPLPPEKAFSKDFRDFCRACLRHDPQARATAVELVSHPFILKHRSVTDRLPRFLRSASDAHAAFDEVSLFFTHQYYQLLTAALLGDGGETAAAIAAIEPLYQDSSEYRFRTDVSTASVARGRSEIVAQLHRNVHVLKNVGFKNFEVKSVECAGMGGTIGGVLLHVHGRVTGRLGSNAFAEAFALEQAKGAQDETCFCIAHQSFASLRGPSEPQGKK